MAGFSGEATISRPESVTAERIFLRITSGSSVTLTVPWGDSEDLDIFDAGSCRSMTRAPSFGIAASGRAKVSPKRPLNRWAMSRVSSRCWRWSSPTGTRSAW